MVWRNGRLMGDAAFVRYVEGAVEGRWKVAFNYWAPITAGLDDPWSAYITIGACWVEMYDDTPMVSGVPKPPGGYEPEGPVTA